MKRNLLLIFAISFFAFSFSQSESSFKEGEWLKFRMSYSNFFKAGNATLAISSDMVEGKPVYHVVGKGWTTGMIKWFFKVEVVRKEILLSSLKRLDLLQIPTERRMSSNGPSSEDPYPQKLPKSSCLIPTKCAKKLK